MFDREFFKMALEFLIIIGVGMLLVYVFSGYMGSADQTAAPTQVGEK